MVESKDFRKGIVQLEWSEWYSINNTMLLLWSFTHFLILLVLLSVLDLFIA